MPAAGLAALAGGRLSCLGGADLSQVNLDAAYLYRANLQGVDLRSARKLTQSQIDEAITDKNTQCPAKLKCQK